MEGQYFLSGTIGRRDLKSAFFQERLGDDGKCQVRKVMGAYAESAKYGDFSRILLLLLLLLLVVLSSEGGEYRNPPSRTIIKPLRDN